MKKKQKSSGLKESKNSLFTLIAAKWSRRVPVEMLWQLGFSAVPGQGEQCSARSGAAEMSLAFPPQPWGQVSNVCSLRVSHRVLNRGRTCHSTGWHISKPQISRSPVILRYESSDNYNKSDTREVAALISVNQTCQTVAGEVAGKFLRDMQSVTPGFFSG